MAAVPEGCKADCFEDCRAGSVDSVEEPYQVGVAGDCYQDSWGCTAGLVEGAYWVDSAEAY